MKTIAYTLEALIKHLAGRHDQRRHAGLVDDRGRKLDIQTFSDGPIRLAVTTEGYFSRYTTKFIDKDENELGSVDWSPPDPKYAGKHDLMNTINIGYISAKSGNGTAVMHKFKEMCRDKFPESVGIHLESASDAGLYKRFYEKNGFLRTEELASTSYKGGEGWFFPLMPTPSPEEAKKFMKLMVEDPEWDTTPPDVLISNAMLNGFSDPEYDDWEYL